MIKSGQAVEDVVCVACGQTKELELWSIETANNSTWNEPRGSDAADAESGNANIQSPPRPKRPNRHDSSNERSRPGRYEEGT